MLDMYPERYKINGKYEFLINFPLLSGKNGLSYNRWRQSLSPTVQTQNDTAKDSNDHYVLGYEANQNQIGFTDNSWGGLALSNKPNRNFIDGAINTDNWYYAIGSCGTEYYGSTPSPFSGRLTQIVELYVRINKILVNPGIYSCDPKVERTGTMSLYVFIYIVTFS